MYEKTPIVLVLAIAGYVAFIACSDMARGSCTEVPCKSSIVMRVNSKQPLPDGLIEFRAETNVTNPVTFSCEIKDNKFVKNNDSNEIESGVFFDCSHLEDGTAGNVSLTFEDHAALIDAETLGVAITLEQQILFDNVFIGTFEEDYPNGEECDEHTCIGTQVSIAIE